MVHSLAVRVWSARHAIGLFDIVPDFYLAWRYDDAYFGAWKNRARQTYLPSHALAMSRLPFWTRTGRSAPSKILSFIQKAKRCAFAFGCKFDQ